MGKEGAKTETREYLSILSDLKCRHKARVAESALSISLRLFPSIQQKKKRQSSKSEPVIPSLVSSSTADCRRLRGRAVGQRVLNQCFPLKHEETKIGANKYAEDDVSVKVHGKPATPIGVRLASPAQSIPMSSRSLLAIYSQHDKISYSKLQRVKQCPRRLRQYSRCTRSGRTGLSQAGYRFPNADGYRCWYSLHVRAAGDHRVSGMIRPPQIPVILFGSPAESLEQHNQANYTDAKGCKGAARSNLPVCG